MGNNDVVVNNPLRALGLEDQAGKDNKPVMGLVMARAGLGKTAILVQFALDCMLLGNKVLHVSIGEGIDKTRTWYDDMLALLNEGKNEPIPELMKNRMIMTFKESNFSNAILEERLNDFVQQNIYKPECIIIDGYDFVANDRTAIEELRDLMVKVGVKMVWFSAVSHREDTRVSSAGVPAPCHEIDDLFDSALLINPEGDAMKLKIVKCDACKLDPGTTLMLDPSTMLIQKA